MVPKTTIVYIYYRELRDDLIIQFRDKSDKTLILLSQFISDNLNIDFKIPKWHKKYKTNILQWSGKTAKLLAWYIFKKSGNKYYKQYVLFNQIPESEAEELFIALGNKGKYLINRKNNGIVIHMNCDSENSLIWSKRLSKIIENSHPIPINKGKIKYYSLYIPTINMQDIKLKNL